MKDLNREAIIIASIEFILFTIGLIVFHVIWRYKEMGLEDMGKRFLGALIWSFIFFGFRYIWKVIKSYRRDKEV